ncbi:MAG: NAD-dependent epimerase/dehydratase, partial [Pseudonocardiales bacterium]|nr:NAD-dependent epimerase/dehydratase [Pseudonocardiales bacterium]
MSVLVLGSSGLVGRRLVARLATEGRTVVACDVVGPTAAPIAGVSYVQVDITRLDRILSVIAEHQVEQIALLSYIMGPLMSPLHSDILLACDVNVSGVANVLEAARLGGVRRLAFLSTVGVYGPQEMYGDRTVVEDERLAPTSLYGRMKLLNESICDRYAALYGLEVVKVRPSSILGSGSTIWPSRFIERVAVGEIGLVPYGEPGRDNVIA